MKHPREIDDHLYGDEDDEIQERYSSLYLTYNSYVFLNPGWTHAAAEDTHVGDTFRHAVYLPQMDCKQVEALLTHCAPCHCARCVEYLLEQS